MNNKYAGIREVILWDGGGGGGGGGGGEGVTAIDSCKHG